MIALDKRFNDKITFVEGKLEGFDAVIVQHEVDHLQGILFTQRALEQNKRIFKEIDGELEEVQLQIIM